MRSFSSDTTVLKLEKQDGGSKERTLAALEVQGAKEPGDFCDQGPLTMTKIQGGGSRNPRREKKKEKEKQ